MERLCGNTDSSECSVKALWKDCAVIRTGSSECSVEGLWKDCAVIQIPVNALLKALWKVCSVTQMQVNALVKSSVEHRFILVFACVTQSSTNNRSR